MSKRVHLGKAEINGVTFAADQDALIKLKVRFEPIVMDVDYEFQRPAYLQVYVSNEEDRKKLQDLFYGREQSVTIVTISGRWEILHNLDPRPQAAATPDPQRLQTLVQEPQPGRKKHPAWNPHRYSENSIVELTESRMLNPEQKEVAAEILENFNREHGLIK